MRLYLCDQNVPIGFGEEAEPLMRQVGAQISVRLLASDQLGGDAIQFLSQTPIPRVGPGECGGVHPLADVFADPGLAARLLVISGEERHGVDGQQPFAFVGVDPRSQPAVDVHRPRARAPRRRRLQAAATLGGSGSTPPASTALARRGSD